MKRGDFERERESSLIFFRKTAFISAAVITSLFISTLAFATGGGNIVDTGNKKYSWSENSGWQNYRPSNSSSGITVTSSELSGYLWCENIGWVKLKGTAQDSTAYGVTNDGSGNLSGYGWSENAGWINFAPTGAAGANAAKINTTTRQFSGYVWAENVGWVALSGTALDTTAYYVQTTWPPTVNTWTYTSSTKALVLNFNESMVDSQTTATDFTIATSAAGANAFALTGGTVTGGTSSTLTITLNSHDADVINKWQGDGIARPTPFNELWISYSAGASKDQFGNSTPARATANGLQCSLWQGDAVPPVINSTDYTASNKRVTFVFSQTININTFTAANLANLSIQDGTTTVTLSGATIISAADSTTMIAKLTPAEDAAIYAIRNNTLRVVVGASCGIKDLAANELAQNTYATSTYSVTYHADVTAPVVTATAYTQASRKLSITFDEYVDVATFTAANLANLSIQDGTTTVTLSGASIITTQSSTIMEATLTVAEDSALASMPDKNILRLVVGANCGIKDLSGNQLATNTDYAHSTYAVTYNTAASTTITGILKDSKSGVIIANAVVNLYDSAGNLRGTATSDVYGAFTINANVPSGDYTLNINKPPLFKAKVQAITVTAGTPVAVGNVLIDPFGIVFDAVTGEPIADANVILYTAGGVMYGGSPQPNPQSSRADGGYNFDVAPGTYYLTASKDGYADYRGANFQVIADVVEWNIPMTPGGSAGDSQYLSIRHTVNKTTATTGDILTYTIRVTNISTVNVTAASVTSSLPHSFKFAAGTSTINGIKQADPANKQAPVWSLGTVTAGTTQTITYRAIIGPDAKTGKNKAYASVTGTAAGASTSAGPSTAVVDVKDGLFCQKELVIGKVFDDKNNDGVQDPGEEGVAGVALVMEDGKTMVTDEKGRFSIPDVPLGEHVLRVDQRMLPGGPLTKESTLRPWEGGKSGDSPSSLRWTDLSAEALAKAEGPEAISKGGIASSLTSFAPRNDSSTNSATQSPESPFSHRRAATPSGYADNSTNPTNSINSMNPMDSVDPMNPATAANPPQSNYTSLIDRRTMGSWIEDTLFTPKPAQPLQNPDGASGMPRQRLAYRADVPRATKFFRVYETQSTKVDIPLQLLTKEEAKAQEEKDKRPTQFMMVSLADGQFGYLAAKGNLQDLKDGSNEGLKNSFNEDGTIKAYLKGRINGEYLLTARFDSSKEYQDHLFEYINPEKYYPIYGDRSTLLNDSDSQEKVYARLDRADSYAMYGNYSTEEFAKTQLSRYARTLSGGKGHLEAKDFSSMPIAGRPNIKLDVFGTETRQEKREDRLAGRGVSGPYFLSRKPILEFTEIIRIEVRDKDKPDTVLETKSMARDVDYDIDYDQGKILFKQPVPTYNDNGDPYLIIVNYEYAPLSGDEDCYIMGTRGEVVFDKVALGSLMTNFKAGGQFIAEQRDSSNLRLGGVDATAELFPGTTVGGEFAHSYDLVNKPGNAWRLEAETHLWDDRIRAQAYATEIDPNFANPVNVTESGIQKFGATAEVKPIKDVSVIADVWKRRSITAHTYDIDAKVDAYYRSGRYLLGTGYEYNESGDEKGLTPLQVQNSIFLQAGARVSQRLIASAQYKFTRDETKGVWNQTANTLTPRLDYLIDKETSVYARSDCADIKTKGDGPYTGRNTTVVGMMRARPDGGRNYVEYGFTGEKVETINIGNDQNVPLTDTLSLSSYDSNVLSKDKSEENVGYAARWKVFDDLYADFAVERTKTTGNYNFNENAQSVTAEYRPKDSPNTIGVKLEQRFQMDTRAYNADANARWCINDDLYLISRGQFQFERDKAAQKTNRLFQRLMGGVAYRPVNNNKLNMLAKYDYSRDVNHTSASDLTDYAKQIAQVEAVYDWTKKTELYCKYALKFAAENITDITTYSLTDLITARIRYKFTDTLDVAGLYHVINGRAVNAIKQGAQAEIGVTLYGHVRIAGGWTFTDYTDADVSSDSYLGTGPYIRASLALLDPDLESMPGVKNLVQDRSDAARDRLVKARVKAIAREETLALNEKFRYAELLYKEGKYTEARAAYEEVANRMASIESDADKEIRARVEAEEAAVAKFDEAQTLFAAGRHAEARALFEQVAKR